MAEGVAEPGEGVAVGAHEPGEGVAVGSRVRVDGLIGRPELNGSLATVMSRNSETGRWNVLVDDRREELALKLEALTVDAETRGLIVGTRVRIADIDKRPELNGKLGTVSGFQGERCSVYVEAIKESVALHALKLAVADEAPSAKTGGDDGERVVRVECNGVKLKLTLTTAQLRRPFAVAILRPFLKAYSKKKGLEEVDVKEVAQVTVDSDGQTQLQVLSDIHIFSAQQCLEKLTGDIDIDVFLKADMPSLPPAPQPPKQVRLPKDSRVMIQGLVSHAGAPLNGSEGRVTGFNAASERYDVTLKDDGKVVSCRMENLIDLAQHQV
jgi:hypothetical protein